MNNCQIIGNLVKDPELTTTTSGVSVARFTVAVQRKFKNAEGEYDTDFLNCVAWRNTAEFMQKYFKKGEKIAVTGSIQTRTYEASDKTKRYVTEIVANEVEKLNWDKQGQERTKQDNLEPVDDTSDLPF